MGYGPSSQLRQLVSAYREAYGQLEAVASLDALEAEGFPNDPDERREVERLILNLTRYSGRIDDILQSVVRNGGVRLNRIAAEDYEFYRARIAPDAHRLGGLLLYSLDHDPAWLGAHPSGPFRGERDHLFDVFRVALEVLAGYDAEDVPQLEPVLDSVSEAQELVASDLFQPDLWAWNIREARPMLPGKGADSFPPAVYQRLTDMYRSFVFGAWTAAIASARANLEYMLRDGLKRDDQLGDLIRPAEKKWPALKEIDLKFVQSVGNKVMHPQRRDDVAVEFPKVRNTAKECLSRVIRCAEIVYRG